MAKKKNTQPPPSKGQSAKGPGKPTAQNPAPASKPKETSKCPRCYDGMSPFDNATGHKLPKCNKHEKHSARDKIKQLWPLYPQVGDEDDKKVIADVMDADALLTNTIPTKQSTFKDHQITKHMLEHAFRTLYDAKGANLADVERSKKPKVGLNAPPSNPKTNSTSSGSGSDMKQQAPTLIVEGVQRLAEAKTEEAVKLDVLASGQYPIDTSLCNNLPQKKHFSDTPILVTTNHIAVRKHPAEVFVYSIGYGKTVSVPTKKQMQEQQAKQDSQLADATAKIDLEEKSDRPDGVGNNVSKGAEHTADGGRKEIAQRSEKSRVFSQLQSRPELQGIHWATDYTLFWTLQKLPDTALTISDIDYSKLSGRKYKLSYIEFTFRQSLDLGSTAAELSKILVNRATGQGAFDATDRGASMRITALNALVSSYVGLANDNIIPVGPNKFFLKNGWKSINSTLNTHRGYFTSIRPGSKTALLNVNLATSAFFNPISVAQYFRDLRDPRTAMSTLKGLNVRIAYQREKFDDEYDPNLEANRHRVIAGFGLKPSIQTFELKGEPITVADYFFQLGYPNIQFPDYPCVSVNIAPPQQHAGANGAANSAKAKDSKDKPKPTPQWILPELLHIDLNQPYMNLLPPECTEKMIEVAVRAPAQTQSMIISEGFQTLGLLDDPSPFNRLGLSLGSKLLQVPARLLATPRIVYGKRGGAPVEAPVETASWNMFVEGRSVTFWSLPSKPIANAVCTIDLRAKPNDDLEQLGQALTSHMKRHGFKFAQNLAAPAYIDASAWRGDDIALEAHLREKLKKAGNPELAVVLLDRKESEPYGAIKRVCDQWRALHTVCVVSTKAKNSTLKPQTLSNLALKMNMKLGGQNHLVGDPASVRSAFHDISKDTIVFGADVSHAGSEMPSTPSVAAVVASDDASFGNFPGSMRL